MRLYRSQIWERYILACYEKPVADDGYYGRYEKPVAHKQAHNKPQSLLFELLIIEARIYINKEANAKNGVVTSEVISPK